MERMGSNTPCSSRWCSVGSDIRMYLLSRAVFLLLSLRDLGWPVRKQAPAFLSQASTFPIPVQDSVQPNGRKRSQNPRNSFPRVRENFSHAIKNSGHSKPTHYTAIILTMSNYRLNSKSFIDGVIIKCSSQMP